MIPKNLQHEDMNFVLLEKGGKKPFQMGWQNKNIKHNDREIIDHINRGGNYGVRGGGNLKLVVVDFDNAQVQEEAMKLLPETFTVRTGSGLLHLYYLSNGCESFKIFSEDMDTLADIQGEGKQVVGPNSTHPNGNKYETVKDISLEFIEYSELKAIMTSFDKKPQKEKVKYEEDSKEYIGNNLLDDLQRKISMEKVLSWLGINTAKNPTQCPLHSSKGGKCLGFQDKTAHCFHCDGSWNIFSIVKDYKKCDFKEALEIVADIGNMRDELEQSRKKFKEQRNLEKLGDATGLKKQVFHALLTKDFDGASELIVKDIEDKNYIYTTKDDTRSEMWIYEDGIYVPNGKSFVKQYCRTILEHAHSSFLVNLVVNKIEADTFINQEEFFDNKYIDEVPVKNGILNISTKQLTPFDPNKIFFNKLPVTFKPKTKCKQIDKFLSEVLSKEDDKKIFYELGGFCLINEYKFEKAFMFVGNGRNGKDKSLELIKRLIGIENCCSVPLASIVPDSFIISEFYNKMANLAGEISNHDLKDTSMFKALTGRSLQSAPRKFLKPITFVNHAKFIFACNELPMVYDNSKGFWDRWVVLDFPYTFVPQHEIDAAEDKEGLKLRDECIIEKITTEEEMSGLLNMFLEGLDRIIENKGFSSTTGSDEIKKMWVRKSNSVMAFCLSDVEENYDSYITKKEFRRRYTDYCKKHKVPIKSDYVIKRTVEEAFGASEGNRDSIKGWSKSWEGISWKK